MLQASNATYTLTRDLHYKMQIQSSNSQTQNLSNGPDSLLCMELYHQKASKGRGMPLLNTLRGEADTQGEEKHGRAAARGMCVFLELLVKLRIYM